MNKLYTLMLAVLMTVTLVSLASATYPANSALVAGKIYENNYADTVADANVTVTCAEKSVETVSLSDGAYVAKFNTNDCGIGDTVTVVASKGDMSGTNSGMINDGSELQLDLNFAVVNVNLIPEFGLLIGSLTVISAVAVFFIIRRK